MTKHGEGIAAAILVGALIPVQVFGGGDPDEAWGYGLCDRFSTHAPAGSDCNRAAFFLLRPSDTVMGEPAVRAALETVLDNPGEDLWD